jgi:putative MATE family efflux protein
MYKQNNLSQGNVVKQLILFALPFILSNLIQSFYNVADMIVVGQFSGPVSMSGVSIGGQVTLLMTNIAVGINTGATVLIAQSVGASKLKQLQKIIGTLLTSLLILAIIMSVLMLTFHTEILTLIKTPEESFQDASNFLNITALGTVFIFGYNALSAIMRGMGDSKNPLRFIAISCFTNVALDLLLVGVFHMGAIGAGIATVTSQAFSMLLCVIYLVRKKFVFNFNFHSFGIDLIQLRAILKLGVPISIQNVIANISFLFIMALVNSYGVTASAAIGAVGKYNGFAVLPMIAMNAAISTMCAQNLGAGNEERAKKTCLAGLIISIIISYTICIFTVLFPEQILGIFTRDKELIHVGVIYLRAFCIDYLLVPFYFSLNGLFIGAGHSTFSLFTNIMAGIVVRMPMAYFLSNIMGMGIFGVGLAVPAATLSAVLLNLWFLLSGRWKMRTIHIKEEL